jgi:hypothetical protein
MRAQDPVRRLLLREMIRRAGFPFGSAATLMYATPTFAAAGAKENTG